MRKYLQIMMAAMLLLLVAPSFAQISEDFEPSGSGFPIKDELIAQNWMFPDFNINPLGVTPLEGLQSMGSGPSWKYDQSSGIVTPFLSFSNSENLQFQYSMSRTFSSACRRWIIVNIADSLQNITQIDSIEVTSSTADVNYNVNINGHAGTYVVYINVRGEGCNSRFIIDNFNCTASNAGVGHPAAFIVDGNTTNTGGNTGNSGNPVPPIQKDLDGITLFPNPANNNINVHVFANGNQFGEVTVFNIDGSKMFGSNMQMNDGSNYLSLNIETLPVGNYFVSVKNNDGVFTKRFVRAQ